MSALFYLLRCALAHSVESKCLFFSSDYLRYGSLAHVWLYRCGPFCVVTKVEPLIDNEGNVEKCFIILRDGCISYRGSADPWHWLQLDT